ncbi:MAG: phosphatase PAP2 family protein [Nitrososphaerota archaeon]|jgi:membrane-associated phospholipid phosphatase|nr:phosphatase PAP2 family protein [Nitrososphaerota archaeon]
MEKEEQKEKKKEDKKKLTFDYRSSRFFALLFPVTYLLAIGIFCLQYHIIPGPEFLVLAFLIYAAYNKTTWRFLKDWLPFITVFISYQIMYGIVGTVSQNNLHAGPYNLEMGIFGGQLPCILLQEAIRLPVLDYVGAFFYSLHFFAPTIFAYILWKASPPNYWKYTVAFGLCTYGALITFLFYPVAPPWIEVSSGVSRILTDSVDVSLGIPVYKTLFDFLSSNLYAAFPSMHSALPFLISLFAIKIWKKKALPILIFPFGVWFSAVYLGEHYVVDVLGGIAYALLAFIVVERVLPLLSTRSGIIRKYLPQLKPLEKQKKKEDPNSNQKPSQAI